MTRERTAVRLLFQCVAPAASSEIFDGAAAGLRSGGERVVLVESRLSRLEYAQLLGAMDIVLVPYTAPDYSHSTSGIFAEAVATGRPVVVPTRTWMAAELDRGHGAGVIYDRDDPLAFVRGCAEAVDRFPELRARALGSAPAFADYHSARNLARLLVDPRSGSAR